MTFTETSHEKSKAVKIKTLTAFILLQRKRFLWFTSSLVPIYTLTPRMSFHGLTMESSFISCSHGHRGNILFDDPCLDAKNDDNF